uniref:Uncharacterized protein n=1 Tax=Clytia hemisphaerica TaxID=252671 RepID=A0A7M5XD29_9CNID|eukprot:TCONS_00005810-protein
MKLSGVLSQMRFNFQKHFIQNPGVKTYTMESLGHKGDIRFGYSEPFQLLNNEATTYIRKLTMNDEFVRKTKFVTSFSPFVLRNCAMHDKFLNDIYTSKESEQYFSDIVGEDMKWLSNSWDASHMNVQEKVGLDTKIFDWHMDSQPLTLIINVSDMPDEVIGGSTILKRHDDGTEIELRQPAPGYATIFRGSGVFHRGSAANYRRIIYVKTMEFKDVSILDKTDALFSTQYSEPVDMLSQHLQNKLSRLQKQVEFVRDHPERADEMVEIVRQEMENNQVFAKYAFQVLAGQETVDTLIEKKLIQNVY